MNEIDISAAKAAILSYQQADADGIMVLVSRQAIHEILDVLTAAEAERDALRAIVQAYRDGDLPDLTAVHMAAVERGKDIMRAERDEALGMVAALREAADGYYNHATCDVSEQMAKEDALQDALDDTAAAAREWEAQVVERCAEMCAEFDAKYAHYVSRYCDEMRPMADALRAEAARVREGRG